MREYRTGSRFKGNFKVGDRVFYRDEEEARKILGIRNYNLLESDYILSGLNECAYDDDLRLAEGVAMFEEGQIIVRGNMERKILGIAGQVVFLSEMDDFDVASTREIYTFVELERDEWKIKDSEDVKEVTLDEVAEKFGVDPENIRIKKEAE